MLLAACMSKPYNDFKPYSRGMTGGEVGVGAGAATAAVAGASLGPGVIAGGAAGVAFGAYQDSVPGLKMALKQQKVEVVEYGDTMTLIVPTDIYYVFDTAELNDLQYEGLHNILKLIQHYPQSRINIVGFTDDVGSWRHKKKLSLQRAQMMRTFLWANGVQLQRLSAVGYADHYDIAENTTVWGSEMNRRIEIQWKTYPQPLYVTTAYERPIK